MASVAHSPHIRARNQLLMINTKVSSREGLAGKNRRGCDIHRLPRRHCKSCVQTRSTSSASQAVKHRQTSPSETHIHKRAKHQSEQHERLLETRFYLPRELDVSAELQSLAQLYDDYTMHSNLSLFDTLPNLLMRDSIGFFQHAIKAVSLASAARQRFQSGLMAKARAEYGQAISKANAALRDECLVEDDSLLAGTFWAGMFEILVTDRPANNTIPDVHGCHPHINGALALLQLRAKRNLVTEMDRATFVFIRHTILMGLLASLRTDTRVWLQFEALDSSWTTSVALDPVVREAVKIWTCARAVIARPKTKIEEETAFKLAELGLKAAKDLSDVVDGIDVSAGEDYSGQSLFNGVLNSSTRTNRVIARCLYRSVEVHVLEATLQLLQTSQYGTWRGSIKGTLESKFRSAITLALDAICEDVAMILESNDTKKSSEKVPGLPYRGLWALWGIIVVLRSPFAEIKQKTQMREQSVFLAKQTGIGRAYLVAAM